MFRSSSQRPSRGAALELQPALGFLAAVFPAFLQARDAEIAAVARTVTQSLFRSALQSFDPEGLAS